MKISIILYKTFSNISYVRQNLDLKSIAIGKNFISDHFQSPLLKKFDLNSEIEKTFSLNQTDILKDPLKTGTSPILTFELNKDIIKVNTKISAKEFNGQVQSLIKIIRNTNINNLNFYIKKNKNLNSIKKQQFIFESLLPQFKTFYLKNRIKRFSNISKKFFHWRTNAYKKWRSPAKYLKRNRRFKKSRKLFVKRLRKVHWVMPSYIYFDVRSLRAVYLYNPVPEEILFSFKCSLRKIHSFYKGLGL